MKEAGVDKDWTWTLILIFTFSSLKSEEPRWGGDVRSVELRHWGAASVEYWAVVKILPTHSNSTTPTCNYLQKCKILQLWDESTFEGTTRQSDFLADLYKTRWELPLLSSCGICGLVPVCNGCSDDLIIGWTEHHLDQIPALPVVSGFWVQTWAFQNWWEKPPFRTKSTVAQNVPAHS